MFPPTQSITVGTSNRAHERNCRKWMAVVNLHTDDQHCLGGSVFFSLVRLREFSIVFYANLLMKII